jgi:simple sugar transport system ATP-binding protein
MTTPLLDARGLAISFGGVQALRGVDVQLHPGEIVCLAGENGSGKSTFVKIVSGVYQPDAGEISIGGEPLGDHHPRTAIAAGVQVIYQDLSLFDHLTVAENISMNRMLNDGNLLMDKKAMRRIAAEQLARVGVDLPLGARVSTLSVANKQVVAICRALSMDARVLFMDEPTTALTTREVDQLLRIVLDLRNRGLAVVFISHKLDEVFQVADRITIFRDGSKVGDFLAADLDERSLAFHMTGREVTYTRYHRTATDDAPLLSVDRLSRAGNYSDISFDVRPGDILGITGLLGSGRTELALSLFGLNPPDSGEVRVRGTRADLRNPWDAIDHGIALVPENRLTQGLFTSYSVARNVSAPQLSKVLSGLHVIRPAKEKDLAAAVVGRMGVNNKDTETVVGNLSGGNQQKVVIGKWIASGPSIFVLDSPTVGVDIGSKSEIYRQVHRLAEEGMGVIVISDEPDEIIANCNRVLVMHDGELVARFVEDDLSDGDFKRRLAHLISDPDAVGAAAPDSRGALS